MDFVEQIQVLASKINKQRDLINTEEATKNAFIMPFIAALGYDVFDPNEVIPEFIADVGTKKGEKVDYLICHSGVRVMIFECKKIGTPLSANQASQLFRYYPLSKAKFGVLTDGAVYQFFSDLDETNKMDQKPFLEVDISNPQHPLLPELKRFAKSTFDLNETLDAARDLKYLGGVKIALMDQLRAPEEEFVRFFAGKVYTGQMRQKLLEQFEMIVKRAFNEFIMDKVDERLRTALNKSSPDQRASTASALDLEETAEISGRKEKEIETIPEEIEAYHIVKALLRQTTDPHRVAIRDTKSYCGILLDDNNRKPLCRLYLHGAQRYIGLFDERKEEKRHAISDLDEIFKFGDHLQKMVTLYDTNQIKDTREGAESEDRE